MNLSFLNPYELLGVTVDSDISTLTKNYYKLALLCHPDKGGNQEDFVKLIKGEIVNFERYDTTVLLALQNIGYDTMFDIIDEENNKLRIKI
jgi:curved DNA-binding protein CbpA